MTDRFDEWSDANAGEYLKALGQMSLRHNHLEIALLGLIGSYLRGVAAQVRDQLLVPLNNSQKLNLLQTISREMEPSSIVRDRLEHFARGFSICAENRNIALHAVGHIGQTHFHLIKKQARAPFDHNVYSARLVDLEAISASMLHMTEFGFAVSLFVRSEQRQGLGWDWPIRGPVVMPEKPALPQKLVAPPPGQEHPDGPIFF